MSNNILKELNTSAKILILLFLIFMLFVTSSIFFVGFEFILMIILLILSNEKLKKYISSLKIFICLVPFIIILYLIFKFNLFIILVKIFITLILLNIFLLTTSFLGLYNGIYTLFRLYSRNERKLNNKCLKITTRIYFVNKFLNGSERLDKAISKGLSKKQIKNYVKVKYILAKNDSKFIKDKLSLKIFKAHFEKINNKSKLYLLISILLAIIVVIKEVI